MLGYYLSFSQTRSEFLWTHAGKGNVGIGRKSIFVNVVSQSIEMMWFQFSTSLIYPVKPNLKPTMFKPTMWYTCDQWTQISMEIRHVWWEVLQCIQVLFKGIN